MAGHARGDIDRVEFLAGVGVLECAAVATPLDSAELDPLLAFFEDAARRRTVADPVAPLAFFLLGLGGAAFGIVVFDVAWHGRFRGVRKRLIEAASERGAR